MAPPLPLPLGEVSERSEDGEGTQGCKALSVTCGDSSPRGRAKAVREFCIPHILTLFHRHMVFLQRLLDSDREDGGEDQGNHGVERGGGELGDDGK